MPGRRKADRDAPEYVRRGGHDKYSNGNERMRTARLVKQHKVRRADRAIEASERKAR